MNWWFEMRRHILLFNKMKEIRGIEIHFVEICLQVVVVAGGTHGNATAGKSVADVDGARLRFLVTMMMKHLWGTVSWGEEELESPSVLVARRPEKVAVVVAADRGKGYRAFCPNV